MGSPPQNTKERILTAAGILFAKHGYSAVSTRMVAEKAGVRHGTVHYHFKSKKVLYFEVFRSIFSMEQVLTYDVLLEQEPIILDTPSGKAYAIQRIVSDYFHRGVRIAEPWKRQLVLRELYDHSPVFDRILNELMILESKKMREFYFLLNPNGTEVDAYIWTHFAEAQMLNYIQAESIIEKAVPPEFIEEWRQKLARVTARSMISILDLPIPDMLK